MIDSEQLEILSGTVGGGELVEHEPIDVDGIAPAVTLLPGDAESLARTLSALGDCGLSALVRGGGNRLGVGNPPTAGDAFVSTERMAGIAALDVSDGVCQLRAGTKIADVRDEICEQGWELPLDPPGAHATLGGCVAAASHGPRAQGFGKPRDVLLGLEVCLASGERTRCGGRVVKNVTGYDLNKLYTGSHGSLGVIESAWLRLRPRPERNEAQSRRFDDLAEASQVAIDASRRGTARVAALCCSRAAAPQGPQSFDVVVEWAGDSASVGADVAWLLDNAGRGDADLDTVDAVRDLQAALPEAGGLRFQIGALPTRLAASIAALQAAGASVLAYPGLCQLYAGFDLESSAAAADVDRVRAVDDIFRTVDRVARDAGGDFVCEAAPTWAKAGREMFGARTDLFPIYQSLKQRFDPGSVLNPGRFAGGL